MLLKSINPATEEVLSELQVTEKPDVLKAVQAAKNAFPGWREKNIEERYDALEKATRLLKNRTKDIAETVTKEMGKPINLSTEEVEETVAAIEFYKENIKFIRDEEIEEENIKAITRYEPIGTFACISPWNYPILTPTEAIVPALLTGNTVVFKPSELTPLSGIEFVKILQETLPANVLNIVIGGPETGKQLVNSGVDAIALTGSVEAGKYVAEHAQLRRFILELGGSDPFIICEDADIDRAIDAAVYYRFRNSGQICISAKRFFVTESIANEFIDGVVEKTKKLRIGNGIDPNIDIGPLVSNEQRILLEEQLKDAVNKGAEIQCGGKRPDLEKGFFYPPTIITNINTDMKVMTEEVFGPVMPIMKVDSMEEAIELANKTAYGLGGSVWSTDTNKAFDIAKKIDSGMLWINDTGISPSDGFWGGIKQSGSGRSRHGILDFVKVKQITAYTGKEKKEPSWF